MIKFFQIHLLSLVLLFFVSLQAEAQQCPGYEALRGADIILKPGETRTFIYDFSQPECTVSVRGFWAYLAQPISSDLEGCAAANPRNLKVEMNLVDLTTGVVGTRVSGTSVILNDPEPTPEGYYVWGNYNVKGHVLELKITLDPRTKKCVKANLRYAYGMGG